MKKYRVIYNPKYVWFEVQEKKWFGWKYVTLSYEKEDAIEIAKQYCQGLIVWEDKK